MGLPEEDRTGEPNNHCEVILESFLQNELRHIEEARREATLKLEELDLQIKRIRGKISELWVDDDLTKFLSDEEQVRIGRVSV
ncbi:hypothetical protein HZA41_00085, partial [Candidatus Peregrinibacteria bacterium]|nr:hypothetical protein [Candidatus Peregrinibacteria bacterium]